MTTYATYRHIELDKVGYGKKRVRNPPSDIFNVLSSPESTPTSPQSNGSSTPRRSQLHNDSFKRLFGSSGATSTPRKLSFNKRDGTNRNPVTGDGVTSWDQHRNSLSPRIKTERNPVTGEVYTLVSPATTPTKLVQNGFHSIKNGHDGITNEIKKVDKPLTNGQA